MISAQGRKRSITAAYAMRSREAPITFKRYFAMKSSVFRSC
jgi:hypothetical protein